VVRVYLPSITLIERRRWPSLPNWYVDGLTSTYKSIWLRAEADQVISRF